MEQLFDKAEEYDEMLNQGLQLSGENKEFFMEGRLKLMQKHLPSGFKPKRILDFGCGIGETTEALATIYPQAQIVGIDTAVEALNFATKNRSCERLTYVPVDLFDQKECFDLCYVNGVFHHIPLHLRRKSVETVYSALNKGAYFAFFENNPWNPGTRMVMNRIAFDRDAITLSYLASKKLIREGGFKDVNLSKFVFYFPNALKFLRFTEPLFASVPLGAQYMILAKK